MPIILVVDDDRSLRQMLTTILTEEGYTCQEAEHGGPALDILQASTDGMVVLLGLIMPDVDGEMVLEAVAADESLASRHVLVMVTGAGHHATTGRVAALREQLSIPLVPKPFALDQVIDAVEEAVHRWTTRAGGRRSDGRAPRLTERESGVYSYVDYVPPFIAHTYHLTLSPPGR